MWPLRFVMPHDQGQRPAWLIRLGMFLYDHLARRELLLACAGPAPSRLGGAPEAQFTRGFVYSDGWVDDARLVVLNAMDAAEKGAHIMTRTRCESLSRQDQGWQAAAARRWSCHAGARTLRGQRRRPVGGPVPGRCSPRALQQVGAPGQGQPHRGPRLFEHDHAYIFQNPDGRIVFAIPYERTSRSSVPPISSTRAGGRRRHLRG
jgi:glycerol-3-phosphate dehydrogenase